jgi:hypothetical protein
MRLLSTAESKLELSRALRMMNAALEILDEIDAPGDVASHLDLAICRLEKSLGMDSHPPTGIQNLVSQLEIELAESASVLEQPGNPWELDPM